MGRRGEGRVEEDKIAPGPCLCRVMKNLKIQPPSGGGGEALSAMPWGRVSSEA